MADETRPLTPMLLVGRLAHAATLATLCAPPPASEGAEDETPSLTWPPMTRDEIMDAVVVLTAALDHDRAYPLLAHVTAEQAAAVAGVTVWRIYQLMREGVLPATGGPRSRRIAVADLRRWLDEGRRPPGRPAPAAPTPG